MAALNQSETETLRNACAFIDYVLRHGYTPPQVEEGGDRDEAIAAMHPKDVYILKQGETIRKLVHTVVQMKGYYPK